MQFRFAAADPPHIIIEGVGGPPPAIFQNGAWNRTIPQIHIFDDTFVDGNVSSGLQIGSGHRQNLHELILGAQGVALSRDLADISDEIEEHNRELRARADAIPANARRALAVDDFCVLPQRQDIDTAITETERALAAARQQDVIRAGLEFLPFGLPPIDSNAIEALLFRDLPALDRAAADHVQAHIATLGDRAETWIASGIGRIQGGADEAVGKPCPFCAQDLAGSGIIAHYRAYFSEAYSQLKQDVRVAVEALDGQHGGDAPAAFERTIRAGVERAQFWSRFADIPAVQLDTGRIAQVWATAREWIRADLARKQDAPLERIELSGKTRAALADYDNVCQEVDALNQRLQRANAAVALVKEQAEAGNTRLLESDLARLVATRERQTPEIAPLCDAYLAEKAAKAATEQRRETARAALDNYRANIFPTYQDATNDYLRKFGAGFRLDRITSQNIRGGSACTYNVLINNQPIMVSGAVQAPGQPSYRSSLSAGDRNTLALAFFFASLDQVANLANAIVVIDDPVSSLDEHRTLSTVQELRRLIDRSAQVFVLSHSKPFLSSIWEQTDPPLRGAVELVRDGDGSAIRTWDVTRHMVTEYDRMHALLREYVATTTPNNREAAHSIRLVLEGFLRVAYPASFPPGSMLGPFIALCRQRLGTQQQALNRDDVDELDDLRIYANQFHHDTNPAWQAQHINDQELLSFIERTLAFTKR